MKLTIAAFLSLVSIAVASPMYNINVQVSTTAANDVGISWGRCDLMCIDHKPECTKDWVRIRSFSFMATR